MLRSATRISLLKFDSATQHSLCLLDSAIRISLLRFDNATHPGLRPPLSERGWRGSDLLIIKTMRQPIPSRRGVAEGRGVSHRRTSKVRGVSHHQTATSRGVSHTQVVISIDVSRCQKNLGINHIAFAIIPCLR